MTVRDQTQRGAPVSLLWVRQDLRLGDNPALAAAMRDGAVLPVFVLDAAAEAPWALGGAARWWLHHSLLALDQAYRARGARLVLRRGPALATLLDLVRESAAASVHVAEPYEPAARALLDALGEALRPAGVRLHRHPGALLCAPEALRTQSGGHFAVYSPFARACRAQGVDADIIATPAHIPPGPALRSDALEDWRLCPTRPDWAGGLRATWTPGEAGARARLDRFLADGLEHYDLRRDLPGIAGTARLSPHLHWGEISPRQVWHAAGTEAAAHGWHRGGDKFQNELLWREFSAYLLRHHPSLPQAPLNTAFAAMPWRRDAAALGAWQRGATGVPFVDAGMRELWQTGWMHNRVRMVVASFLVKHLLLPWQEGEAWFWDTLVDADLAANAASWQWVAGCGADAAPYFRVFNPVLQGRKFDADGAYVRRWVPELAPLPDADLHAPWEAPAMVLQQAGVRLGETYPLPLVDLAAGRNRALAALQSITTRATASRQVAS